MDYKKLGDSSTELIQLQRRLKNMMPSVKHLFNVFIVCLSQRNLRQATL